MVLRRKVKERQPKKSMTLHKNAVMNSGTKGPYRWNAKGNATRL